MTEAIVALVVVLLAGCGYLAYRYRSERGIESGISSFRRELRALAPRHQSGEPTADPRPRIMRDPAPPSEPTAPEDAAADTGEREPADGDGPAAPDR